MSPAVSDRPSGPVPSRGLPYVALGDDAFPAERQHRVEQLVSVRLRETGAESSSAEPQRGLGVDVTVVSADPTTGPTVLEVVVAPAPPSAGWAGAVDHGLPWRRAGASVARFWTSKPGSNPGSEAPQPVLALDVEGLAPDRVGDFVLGYLLAAHRQDPLANSHSPGAPDLRIGRPDGAGAVGAVTDDIRAVVGDTLVAARGTALARDLAGAPSNIKTPEWLAEQYRDMLTIAGMSVDVLAGEDLADFGGVLAVGGGSAHPPRVLVARRRGAGRRVLVVGKGITFDTGGISVKPAENMHLMRTDMAGSAAVVAAAAAFLSGAGPSSESGSELDLTVVVPMAENMLSGSAYRPGDVVTHPGGRTTEVGNTDAEGRMVLADGIVHGIAVADPEIIVDIATLTGAMKVALGTRTGAVMSTSDDLAAELSHAGAESGERWWRLPLPDDLDEAVESDVADGKQAPSGPGAITAAKFLQPFTEGRPWAHLDIAGPARAEEEIDEVGPVATGFGTRTLARWLHALESATP